MKKIVMTLAMIFSFSLASFAGGDMWLTDFSKAQEIAKQKNLPLFVDFTGSDWCGWCIKLNQEVFSKKVFTDYAKDNLILVELDFPQAKKQDDAIKKQNRMLADKYKIEGYPSILILNPDGTVITRMGYEYGGAEKYVESIKAALKK